MKTQREVQNMMREEADRIAGEDPNYRTRQLFEAIECGEHLRWTCNGQVMPEADAETYR
jgi:catalase